MKLSHVKSNTAAPEKMEEKSLFSSKITDYNQLLVAKKFLFEEMPKKRKSNNLARQAQKLHTEETDLPVQRQSLYQFRVSQPTHESRLRRIPRKGPTFIRTHGRFRT